MTIEIQLTQGKVALIDDEDYEYISQYKWCAAKTYDGKFYAVTTINGRNAYLHRLLMSAPHNVEIDHIDNDGLNCQRDNMRPATHSGNMQNRRKRERNNTSGFKGVDLYKRTGKYRAQIRVNGVAYHLGYFDDPEEAAHVRDEAARELHGEFASLNFPDNPQNV